jgi:hypothetical protein
LDSCCCRCGFIATLSGHYFTPDQTGRVVAPILRWFLAHASSTLIRHLHFGIRKVAQVIEFAVFSITVFRALQGPRPGWRLNSGVADISDCRFLCADRRIPSETYNATASRLFRAAWPGERILKSSILAKGHDG